MDAYFLAVEVSQNVLHPAWIAAGAVFVSTIVNAIVLWAINSRDWKSKATEARRELAFRQLNDLYAPLYLHRKESERLRKRLGPIDGTWRLVDHISEIAADPEKAELVEEILAINKVISELLHTQGGLTIDLKPPDSFDKFLDHASHLRRSWEKQSNQPEDDRSPFPVEIDKDIEAGLSRLRSLAGLPEPD